MVIKYSLYRTQVKFKTGFITLSKVHIGFKVSFVGVFMKNKRVCVRYMGVVSPYDFFIGSS